MLKQGFILVLLAIAAMFAVACDDNAATDGMAVFGVSEINGANGDPIFAATASAVPMTFRWRPYFDPNAQIVEAAPHGDYVIDHYRVVWTAVTAGATVPSPREESTSIFVPVYALVQAGIIVATPTEAASNPAGTMLNANIQFTAHEMGTEKDATFAITVTVHF
jgi:hypothetical protein